MAAENTNADSLHFYLSGATDPFTTQTDPDASLGYHRSCHEARSLEVRRVNPIRNLRVLEASAQNDVGEGSLMSVGVDALRYTAPNGSVGASVTILDGETKVIESNDPDKFVRVKRTSADDLIGSETVTLLDTFNNLWGFDNVDDSESTAGDAEYRAAFITNDSEVTLTNVTLWIDVTSDNAIAIAKETPAGDGTITDKRSAGEGSAPGGLSWVTGTSKGTGLIIGTLIAGQEIGLWVRRTISASTGSDAQAKTGIFYDFDIGATTYSGFLRGFYRIVDESDHIMRLYLGIGGLPDFDAAPYDTFSRTASSFKTATLAFPNTYHVVVRRVNRYGLETENALAKLVEVDASGDIVPTRPSAPTSIKVEQVSDPNIDFPISVVANHIRVTGAYEPGPDGTDRADTWVLYLKFDGTDPDPSVDSPNKTVSMAASSGIETLDTILDSFITSLDNQPIHVLVTTRRVGPPQSDSDNTTATAITISIASPPVPPAVALFGPVIGQHQPSFANEPDSFDKYFIDEGNNIYFAPYPGGEVAFYADTTLVWKAFYDSCPSRKNRVYIPSDWSLDTITPISGTGVAAAIEVASWTGPDKTLYACVDGERVMKIDVTNKRLTINSIDRLSTPVGIRWNTPAWRRYGSTAFMIWDPHTEAWVSYMSLNTAGRLSMLMGFNKAYTQVEIEAL